MTRCDDCSADITVTEVTGPSGARFVTVQDADLAALIYRAEQGYTLATVTGHACTSPANHEQGRGAMVQRECTQAEAQAWQAQYGDGYSAARGDILWNAGPRIELTGIPAEVPAENGAQYVARHVAEAWRIGYTRAWLSEYAQRSA